MKKILLLLPLVLAACSETAQEAPLTGKRIDVLGSQNQLQPEPRASQTQMRLPGAVTNADWPQMLENPAHLPEHLSMPEEVKRAWSRRVGHVSGHMLNTPVIHAGRLFVLDSDNRVTAISSQTGKELWDVRLPTRKGEESDFTGGLAVVGDRLFATTGNGQVFALSASKGELAWQADVGAPLRAAPTVVGDKLLVISHDNRLFALDVRQGNMLWTHSGISENLALASGATPAVSGDTVVVPYTSGDLYALQLSNGQYLWHASLSRLSLQPLGQGVQGIAAAPVIVGETVIATTLNGVVAAFNLTNGQRLWKTEISSSQTPWVAGNIIFVLTDDGQLAALNLKDGAIRWLTELNSYVPGRERDKPRYWSGPVLAGGRLIVVAENGFAMSVNPATGAKVMATQLLKSDSVSVPPIVANNSLFFLTDDGQVVCFK